MIVTLAGSNDFARGAELKKLTADFVREHGDFGLERLDGDEAGVHISDADFPRRLEISLAAVRAWLDAA